MLRRMFLLTLVLIALVVFPAAAQLDVRTGEITAAAPTADFELELSAGDGALIVARAGNADLLPMLLLYDEAGQLMTVSEGLGSSSAYILHRAETSGTYRARARGYNATTGVFQIGMEVVAPVADARIGDVIPYADLPQTRADDGAFVLGDPAAPITIIEFADWTCPHCLEFEPTMEQILLNYVVTGQAKFEFRLLPTAGGNLTALAGALAECAEAQRPGAFWEAYDLFYEYARTRRYDSLLALRIALALNLDLEQIDVCLPTITQWQTDMDFAETMGINGTPALMTRYGAGDPTWIIYAGEPLTSGAPPYEALAEIIEAAQPTPEATASP